MEPTGFGHHGPYSFGVPVCSFRRKDFSAVSIREQYRLCEVCDEAPRKRTSQNRTQSDHVAYKNHVYWRWSSLHDWTFADGTRRSPEQRTGTVSMAGWHRDYNFLDRRAPERQQPSAQRSQFLGQVLVLQLWRV